MTTKLNLHTYIDFYISPIQMKKSGSSPSFRSVMAVLPGQAGDIFYRDQIGNISSSDMRMVDGEIELELQPRFPMYVLMLYTSNIVSNTKWLV